MSTLTENKIRLEDVAHPEQLTKYYVQEEIVDTDTKIGHLLEKTGVIATRSSGTTNSDTLLALLEESVYLGHWRYFK